MTIFSLINVGCVNSKPMPIRPLTIQVLDHETRQPLEGVLVFYSLHTEVLQKYIFWVIPNFIEPLIGSKLCCKDSSMTDKSGEVQFYAQNFLLPKKERFVGEEIFVNLDVNMKTKSAEISKHVLEGYYLSGKIRRVDPVDNVDIVSDLVMSGSKEEREEALFNPVNNYGGVVMVSMAFPPSRQVGDAKGRFEKDENLRLMWGGDTLDKENDLLVVRLKRKEPLPQN
jgi:hypothetical protein